MTPESVVDHLMQSAYSFQRDNGMSAEQMRKLGFSPELERTYCDKQYGEGFLEGQRTERSFWKPEYRTMKNALMLAVDLIQAGTFEEWHVEALKNAIAHAREVLDET